MANTDTGQGAAAPTAQNLESARWMKIVGVVFAAITLLAFLAMGILAAAGFRATFNCDSFSFLAPAFAIGAAMAAVFLGGGAALSGNLGEAALAHPLRVSAGGGVAVLIILFIVFFALKPEDCTRSAADGQIQFQLIPKAYAAHAHYEFWTKNGSFTGNETQDFFVRLEKPVDQGLVQFAEGNDLKCVVRIHVQDRTPPVTEGLSQEAIDPDTLFKIEYRLPSGQQGRFAEDECFRRNDKLIGRRIVLGLEDRKIVYGVGKAPVRRDATEFETGAAFDRMPATGRTVRSAEFRLPVALPVGEAHAAETPQPYAELKADLMSDNDSLRVHARQYLSQNFQAYQSEVLAELFDPQNQGRGDYISSLLHGVIAGIEAADPGLKPQAGRSLAAALPIVGGRENEIVALTGHPDPAVQKQARRLIQRFPVDAFRVPIDAAFQKQDCSGRAEQGAIYAGLFYYYNRIIQEGLNGNLTPGDEAEWDKQIAVMQNKANACLEDTAAVDAALLDYGRAIAYGWSSKIDGGSARSAAETFLKSVDGRQDQYYRQSHIQKIEQLLKNGS